jgi:hypothetical protein
MPALYSPRRPSYSLHVVPIAFGGTTNSRDLRPGVLDIPSGRLFALRAAQAAKRSPPALLPALRANGRPRLPEARQQPGGLGSTARHPVVRFLCRRREASKLAGRRHQPSRYKRADARLTHAMPVSRQPLRRQARAISRSSAALCWAERSFRAGSSPGKAGITSARGVTGRGEDVVGSWSAVRMEGPFRVDG